ncbi:MAG: hypothetical protein IKR73_05580 [Oscillospiraceae bacterium]|nr:hypothetical protein [Oscillospiraceae bacterium]
MKITDTYTIALLMWYFGMDASEVRTSDWTDEEIARAQAYCKQKRFDPIDWAGEWVYSNSSYYED